LQSVHPGETAESVRAATGFDYHAPENVPATADPTEAELAALRGEVCAAMQETYPAFCSRVWGRGAKTETAA
jgi:glutaconate CoA-transferase subunit B